MKTDSVLNGEITVALCGGLGNQLFQYATARALAIRCASSLVLDISWFDEVQLIKHTSIRKYALGSLMLGEHQIKTCSKKKSFVNRVSQLFVSQGRRVGIKFTDSSFSEQSFRFDERVLRLKAPVRLIGYWQSPRYFNDVETQIRKEITVNGKLNDASIEVLNQIQSTDAICIHVRRGDYVTNKEASSFHGLCSNEYYKNGVNRVAQGLRAPHGFVFTDDPAWVRENLSIGIEFTLVDINSIDEPHLDLCLMSACKHFVIANSSLSWWGAWLSTSPNKKVIAPVRWFADSSIDTTDLIPDDWSRI